MPFGFYLLRRSSREERAFVHNIWRPLGWRPGDATVRLEATTGARVMLFGGAGMDGDRKIWWNFVASSRALIDAASERWREQSFPPIPGETEFIPLPERH